MIMIGIWGYSHQKPIMIMVGRPGTMLGWLR
jgi:hypothetical protein